MKFCDGGVKFCLPMVKISGAPQQNSEAPLSGCETPPKFIEAPHPIREARWNYTLHSQDFCGAPYPKCGASLEICGASLPECGALKGFCGASVLETEASHVSADRFVWRTASVGVFSKSMIALASLDEELTGSDIRADAA